MAEIDAAPVGLAIENDAENEGRTVCNASFRCPCPLGQDEPCKNFLDVTVTPYRRATHIDPAEGPDLYATGCPHVDLDVDRWAWIRPGGIEDRLWAAVEEQRGAAHEVAVDAAIERRRTEVPCLP